MLKIILIKAKQELPYHHVTQPLGIMYIAAYLRNNGEHDVRIIDMAGEQISVEETCNRIEKAAPDVVGLSVLTVEAPVIAKIAKKVKSISPGIPVIVGGPHASSNPKSILEDKNVDYIVLGEGEKTMSELVRAIENKEPVNDIKGIAYNKNGEIIYTPQRPYIENLDSLPFPAWDLIDVERYFNLPSFNIVYKSNRYMAIFTTRGCPYHCTYCHNIFGKTIRARSPENVLKEIEQLYNTYGIRELQIIDDNFNVKKERAKKICDLIIKSGMKISIAFPNGVRGDIMDEELLLKLKQAGAYKINYAIETGSPRLQKMLKKNVNLPKLQEIITLTNKLNIFTHGFFMLGFPTETREELKLTIDFAKKSRLNTLGFYIVTPFPGTELYNQVLEMGGSAISTESLDYTDVKSDYFEFTPEELLKAIRWGLIGFYCNLRRTINTIKLLPNKMQLVEFIKLFFNRLKIYSVSKKIDEVVKSHNSMAK